MTIESVKANDHWDKIVFGIIHANSSALESERKWCVYYVAHIGVKDVSTSDAVTLQYFSIPGRCLELYIEAWLTSTISL